MINALSDINIKTDKLQELISVDFLMLNKLLKNYKKQSIGTVPEYIVYINQIITDLQFNDIFSQKLSHMKDLILSLFNDVSSSGSYNNFNLNYAPIGYEILLINIAQINLISKEYSSVIERLQGNLNEIEKIISNSLNISLNLSEFFNNTEAIINQINVIRRSYMDLLNKLEISGMKDELKIEKMLKATSIYTVESEREVLKEIFKVENEGNVFKSESDIEFF